MVFGKVRKQSGCKFQKNGELATSHFHNEIRKLTCGLIPFRGHFRPTIASSPNHSLTIKKVKWNTARIGPKAITYSARLHLCLSLSSTVVSFSLERHISAEY
jgi:hypothetical protein